MNKCKVCNRETLNDRNIRLSEEDGFASATYSISVCDKCLSNKFQTSWGTEFLKIGEKLYVQFYPFDNYNLVTSHRDIDRAFNPEKYEFEEWLNRN